MQLIILGMHRSGTSALAGFFQQSGFYFGPPAQAFPLHDTNEKGFFERMDVVRINDRLLESADASWIAPQRFPSDVQGDFGAMDLQTDATSIIDEMDSHADWFLKDPRLCITLPFWQPLLSDPCYVLVLRHPMDVAKSLFRRGDCPIAVGLSLWEKYTRDMYRHTSGRPRMVIWFEDLMKDPWNALSEALSCPGAISSLKVDRLDRHAVHAWFDQGLVHHTSSDAELSDFATESVISLYRSLRQDPGDTSLATLAPLSKGSQFQLQAYDDQWRLHRMEMERARAWKNRLRSSSHSGSTRAFQFRGQVECLLQSWRWRGVNSAFSLLGRAPVESIHGFSEQSLRDHGDSLYDHLCREMITASIPGLMQPYPLYAQHNPDVRMEMTSRRILLVLLEPPLPSSNRVILEDATVLLAGYGHEVNWLSTNDMSDECLRFQWPVYCYQAPTLYSSVRDELADDKLVKTIEEHDVVVLVHSPGSSDHAAIPHLESLARKTGRMCLAYPACIPPVPDASPSSTASMEQMKQRRYAAREKDAFMRAIADCQT